MTTYVGATEAARRLGVRKATLYAYVSRGLVARRVAPDGRTSLYAVDDLDGARRSQPAGVAAAGAVDRRPDRHGGDDDRRGRRALPRPRRGRAGPDGALRSSGRAAVDRPPPERPRPRGRPTPRPTSAWPDGPPPSPGPGRWRRWRRWRSRSATRSGDDAAAAARRLIGLAPAVLGGPDPSGDGETGVAARLAGGWSDDADPGPLTVALDRALVLLADHELATSTLAVRVAASTRTGPYPALRRRPGRAAGRSARRHLGARPRAARRVRGARRRAGDRPSPRRPGSGCPASAIPSTAARTLGCGRCSRRWRCCPTRPGAATSSTTC